MVFAIIPQVCIFMTLLKYTNAEDNEIRGDTEPVLKFSRNINLELSRNLNSLESGYQISRNVYLSDDYDASIHPSGNSLTWVSFEITRFLVEKVNEQDKHITAHLKMRGTWVDSRIIVNFTGSNESSVVLPYVGKQSHPLIWCPFRLLYIPESISRTNFYDSTKIRYVKLHLSQSFSFGRFPSNTMLVTSSVNQRIVITCVDDVTYSYFPHDIHNCKLKMKSYYVNATMDINIKKGNKKFYRSHNLAGFKISNSIIPETKIKRSSSSGIEYTEFGVVMRFERRFKDYFYRYFLPCILIVTASTVSFIIPLSALPGRLALVVTLFLTLTNMFLLARVNIMTI